MASAALQSVRAELWATCLWPGLPQICLRGAWSGLILAVAFTLLVDLLLASTLIWTELVSPGYRQVGWLVVVAFWLASALGSWAWLATQEPARREAAGGGLEPFIAAQQAYLRGHWPEAERLLLALVQADERDADALLLLATLCRRTDRLQDCGAWLDRLGRLEEAEKWAFELAAERRLLASDGAAGEAEEPTPASAKTLPKTTAQPAGKAA